jgi:hypothetical protein
MFPASSQAGTRANPRMKLALNRLPVLYPNQQVIAVATLLDQSVARSTALARSASPPPQRPAGYSLLAPSLLAAFGARASMAAAIVT